MVQPNRALEIGVLGKWSLPGLAGLTLIWLTTTVGQAQVALHLDGPSDVPPPKLVRTSTTKVLYPDRTPKIVAEVNLYSDDSRKFHGRYVEYYPNGKEFVRGEYQEGQRHGPWVWLRSDGTEGKKGSYEAGRPHGTWVVLRRDGTTAREESYQAGVSHGTWAFYSADGKTPVKSMRFENGKLMD